MPTLSNIVLIAAPDVLSALSQRLGSGGTVLAFSDADALPALEVITERRPAVVVLDRQFAATPRGSALINRIKADPSLAGSEIRVVAHDQDDVEVSPRRPKPAAPAPAPVAGPLGRFGTRSTPRHRVDQFVEVLVDGNLASVVDLSAAGAQVVSPNVLKPNQLVKVSLSDEKGELRVDACIAWSSFEIPPTGGPRYRAGIQFLDANAAALNDISKRHRMS